MVDLFWLVPKFFARLQWHERIDLFLSAETSKGKQLQGMLPLRLLLYFLKSYLNRKSNLYRMSCSRVKSWCFGQQPVFVCFSLLFGIFEVQSQTSLLRNGLMNFDHHAVLRLIFTWSVFGRPQNNYQRYEISVIQGIIYNPSIIFLKRYNVIFILCKHFKR